MAKEDELLKLDIEEQERLLSLTAPKKKVVRLPAHYNHTDLGNSERFVSDHGDIVRYDCKMKKWRIYDGMRWPVDETGQIFRLAKDTVRKMLREASDIKDDDARDALVRHALKSESESKLKAMVSLAESEPGIPVSPGEFDRDNYLLNCLSGTIDLRTGKIREHRPEDYITKLAPVEYNPEARSPLFEKFLERILPSTELRRFVQRALGYSLTGDTGEEKLFFPFGPPATGKSTLLAAVQATLGDYAATADFEAFLANNRGGGARNDIARLAGRRFVVSTEVEDGRKLAEALINQITGGDVVTARFLYSESFEFTPAFKLWLAANNQPRVAGTDGAIWRRILQIPFDQHIPAEERDPAVKSTLRDIEESGAAILAWLVEGCLEWQHEGLGIPKIVFEATDNYRKENDPLAEFMDDCCIIAENVMAENSRLYLTYQEWCHDAGVHRPLGRKKFSQLLLQKGYDQFTDGKKRHWVGIGLSSDTWKS